MTSVPLLQGLPDPPEHVVHGFTTRLGGVSEGPLATLNLARRPREQDASLRENWQRVTQTLAGWDAERLVLAEQIHTARVLVVDEPTGPLAVAGRADALVTTTPGLALAIRTADCVPVLMAVEGAVAAVHAGWRGVAANIVREALAVLCEVADCEPHAVRVVVGPHVSADAYQVGPEVVEGIAGSGVPEPVFVRGDRVDLRAAVSHQLVSAGALRIGHLHHCTGTRNDLYSHRHDGPDTGRQASLIGLLA